MRSARQQKVRCVKQVLLMVGLAAAVAVGCSKPAKSPPEQGAPVGPALSVEETARLMLEALKQGDIETFLAHVDLAGVYDNFPEPMRRTFSFEQFEEALRKAGDKAGREGMSELQYEIVGVEERGELRVVTLRTQSRPGRPWRTFEATFGNFDGTWKITGHGVRRLLPD
jgi:hypothetical protein